MTHTQNPNVNNLPTLIHLLLIQFLVRVLRSIRNIRIYITVKKTALIVIVELIKEWGW